MILTVNGKSVSAKSANIAELLTELGYRTTFVAIELNGVIIRREAYASTELSDGDAIEIVNFVGGG